MLNTNEKLNMAIFNPTNKDPYKISGANLPMPGAWATLIQWRNAGFKVRKGEHPTRIDWTTNRGESRHYNVFHVTQCDPFDDNAVETNARIMELEEAARIAEAMDELAEPEIEAGNPEPEIVDQEYPEIITEIVDTDRVAEIRAKYSLSEIQTAYAEIAKHYASLAQQTVPETRKPEISPEIAKEWNYSEAREYAEKLAGNLKLTKGGYYINTRKGAVWVNGYTFEYRDTAFGIAKDAGLWKITEISTGLLACDYYMKSRKDTLTEWLMVDAKGRVFADKVIEALNKGSKDVSKARTAMTKAYGDAAQGGR